MHTLNALVAQARHQEVGRAAAHPRRLMAHELRLARATAAPTPSWWARVHRRAVLAMAGYGERSASVVPPAQAPQQNLNALHQR